MKKVAFITFLLSSCAKTERKDLHLSLKLKHTTLVVEARLQLIKDSIMVLEKDRTNIINAFNNQLINTATFHCQVRKVGLAIGTYISEYALIAKKL